MDLYFLPFFIYIFWLFQFPNKDDTHAKAQTPLTEDDILNRNSVKRLSSRLAAEAARKGKEEARSKKLAERMVCFSTNIVYVPALTLHVRFFTGCSGRGG